MDYATVAARLTGFADGLTRLFGKQEKQELPPKEDTIHERRNQRAFRGDSRDRGNGGDGAGKDSGESGTGKEGQEERKEGKGHHLYPGAGGKDGAGCQAAGIREGSVHPLTAEYDNYRKRTTKEKDGIYQDAKGDTIKTFLAVYDNLERAAAAEGGETIPTKRDWR